ncbi:GFA family protein [Ferrimonas futtsuensis]|uniref:GFA family protein n=1 Tax=Ferrimonas futtsuensis TaxID=364764 RepID=UPI0004027D30|nr:GFA family protein [Ferrimonas futtsuensis]
MDREASCSCGQLRLEVRGEPIRVSVCHCRACQRRTGSVFGAQARFSESQVVQHGEAAVYERQGDSGNGVHCGFCPRCGSTITLRLEGLDDMVVVPVGAFADSEFPAPGVSVYEARIHPWVSLIGELTHLD